MYGFQLINKVEKMLTSVKATKNEDMISEN
jgi:hypothetical protein